MTDRFPELHADVAASDWQDLRTFADQVLDLQPPTINVGDDTQLHDALTAGWLTCHSTVVEMLHLALNGDRLLKLADHVIGEAYEERIQAAAEKLDAVKAATRPRFVDPIILPGDPF